MTKPMYCPMSLSNVGATVREYNSPVKWQPMECTPDCAWAIKIKDGTEYACAKALEATYQDNVNSRPLEDDAE